MDDIDIQVRYDQRLENARPGDILLCIDGKWMVCQYEDFPDVVREFLGIDPMPEKVFELQHYPQSEEAFVEAMTEVMPQFKEFFYPQGRLGNPGIMSAAKDEQGEPIYQYFGLPQYDPTKSKSGPKTE